MFLLTLFLCFHDYFNWEKNHRALDVYITVFIRMTSSPKQIRQKAKNTEKNSILKEYADANADLHKSVISKITTTRK